MHTMWAVVSVTFPFFALVLCGWVAARARWLPLEAVPGLNGFVLYFALPCLLFGFGRGTAPGVLFHPGVAALWLTCAALVVALAVGLARRRGARWPDAGLGALVAVFPNSGFMGVPLVVALLGEAAAGPLMATLLLDFVLTSSACVGLAHWGAAGGPAQAVGRALRGMARNPMPWAILLGALLGALDWSLPAPLARTVQLLGGAASPVALFTIGAVLARAQMRPQPLAALAGRVDDAWALALLKLLAHPALVWALGQAAVAAGWLPAQAVLALTLTAALPAASNVSLLAERFGADSGRIARVILYSTAVAFFSFSALGAALA